MRFGGSGVSRGVLLRYAIGMLVVILVMVAVSVYPAELGLVRPDPSARRAAVVLAEIDTTLDEQAGFVAFSDALRAAHGSYRALPMRNAADNSLGLAMEAALDCYDAVHESRQAALEGTWDPEVHGRASYWRSFHPAVRLAGRDTLDRETLENALRAEARAYTDDVLALAAR